MKVPVCTACIIFFRTTVDPCACCEWHACASLTTLWTMQTFFLRHKATVLDINSSRFSTPRSAAQNAAAAYVSLPRSRHAMAWLGSSTVA